MACFCPLAVPASSESDGFAVGQNSYKGNIIMVHFFPPVLFGIELGNESF